MKNIKLALDEVAQGPDLLIYNEDSKDIVVLLKIDLDDHFLYSEIYVGSNIMDIMDIIDIMDITGRVSIAPSKARCDCYDRPKVMDFIVKVLALPSYKIIKDATKIPPELALNYLESILLELMAHEEYS